MSESISVLVVDEDPEVLDVTGTFLEQLSDRISTTTVQRVEAALNHLERGGFDCVVSDYNMPGMNGIELYEAISADRPDVPFFVYSAASATELGLDVEAADIDGFVRKGVGTDHYEELVERIESQFETDA